MPARTLVRRLVPWLVVAAWAIAAPLPARAASLSPALDRAMIEAGPDEHLPVVVLMKSFPDRDALLDEVRELDRATRRQHVVSRLRDLAERTQAPIRGLIALEGARVERVRVLWGVNGVALRATPDVIERLAALPGVLSVLLDRAVAHPDTTRAPFRLTPSEEAALDSTLPSTRRGDGPSGGDTSGPNPDADVEASVVAMGAPQVWDTLGYTGAGVLVAIIDTGFDPTHPDLADHVWTNLGEIAANGIDDDGNGYVDDIWGWDFCVDGSPVIDLHGTEVAGQVAGDGTDGLVTGMAPDAEVMSLGIDCDTPSAAWEASDYAITQGAQLINQSYSWWWTDLPDYEGFRRQTDVELAAGVVHVNSAGNHGSSQATYPIPYNISAPANCPAPWIHPDQTLAGGVSSIVAAGDISWSTDTIASSSSLGPSAWEDIQANTDPTFPHVNPPEYLDYPYENGAQMGLIKPDVSAYGSGTTSTCPGPYDYCGFSGTSSAAPSITGTLALMLEAYPEATPAELAEAVMTTAEHRGDPGKNNVYGTGLVQAFAAVDLVETGVVYEAHTFDDTAGGNGDGMLDPGELAVLDVTLRNVTDGADVAGLVAILSSPTPGVTIHDRYATWPTIPSHGSATSAAPHFSLSIDPGLCGTVVTFVLELRYDGVARRVTVAVRVGEPETVTVFEDDFSADLGWTSDPVASTQGAWVREDPIGVQDSQGRYSNPEDDTSDPGAICWVTGNGELTGRKDENNNDVDGGEVILLSPPFGLPYMLSLELSYEGWYYDVGSGNSFRSEVSNDGGQTWAPLDERIYGYGGWTPFSADLFALLPPTDDMRLRFVVTDDGADDAVEGGVDAVLVQGIQVACQDFTPPAALPPNPVGDTLRVGKDPDGHAVLTWDAPAIDAGHDAAVLYRVGSAIGPEGPLVEVGSATSTGWVDVDALVSPDSRFYRVTAENAGGTE